MIPVMAIAAPWDSDSIAAIFGGRQPDPIEGLWQFPADGASLLIVKQSATTYDIAIIDSPRLDVKPGTHIGMAVTTPTKGTYDARLDSKPLNNKHLKKATVALTVNDGYLRFTPYSRGKRVTFWRWLPYLFRVGVYDDNSRPGNLDGAAKVYPIDESNLRPIL